MATDSHHLLLASDRRLADDYKLFLSLCRICHDDIHKCGTSAKLSKMLGQAIYEKTRSREQFMKEFRMNYLP